MGAKAPGGMPLLLSTLMAPPWWRVARRLRPLMERDVDGLIAARGCDRCPRPAEAQRRAPVRDCPVGDLGGPARSRRQPARSRGRVGHAGQRLHSADTPLSVATSRSPRSLAACPGCAASNDSLGRRPRHAVHRGLDAVAVVFLWAMPRGFSPSPGYRETTREAASRCCRFRTRRRKHGPPGTRVRRCLFCPSASRHRSSDSRAGYPAGAALVGIAFIVLAARFAQHEPRRPLVVCSSIDHRSAGALRADGHYPRMTISDLAQRRSQR